VSAGVADAASEAVWLGLKERPGPFDLEGVSEAWADELRRLNPSTFPIGGRRWCAPLRAGTQCLGAFVLADRVSGVPYSDDEQELLKCFADQTTSVLLNLRLADEVAEARELEAFRTMSAFFVHDLKNAAASLNLMLKNLSLHFDSPEFREDAIRAVGNTARRVDEMIARLGSLRQAPQLTRAETDLNQLLAETVDGLDELRGVDVTKELQPLPRLLADRAQLGSVITNLLLNARDALGEGGRIAVRTEQRDGRVILSVADNGCGMSEAFVRDSLFRPFQSTKKNGLGIGMFQSRAIVEAHGGTIWVESTPGKGTTFFASFPARAE
jgi:putative PEP-CTERM system histidine kinase